MQPSKEWKHEVIKDMVKTAKYPYGEQKETREMKIMDVKNYNEICRGRGGFTLNLYFSCCCVTVISLFSTMITISNNHLPSVFVGYEVYK